jgi:mRNA interferase MazF
MEIYKRGDIYWANLSGSIGSEQSSDENGRPVVIIQNDVGNKFSPTVIVAVLTSKMQKAKLPIHIEIKSEEYGLPKDSVILLEQVRTLDKRRLGAKICSIDDDMLKKIDDAIDISMKNLRPKTLLEKLPDDMREYVIATLKRIKKLEIAVAEMKETEIDKDVINIMVNKKLKVLNQFIKYCTQHQLDYKAFYIVNQGVNKEILL